MSDDQNRTVLEILNRMEDGLSRMEANQNRLEANQLQTRTELMARMDRLQNEITAIRDDITVNYGQSDQVRRMVGNVRDEVRGLDHIVSGMQRRTQHLQTAVREMRGDA